MIMKADTDLCIVQRLRRSEAPRNHAIRNPFLALQSTDCIDCTLNDSGVLNQVFIVRQRVKMFAVRQFFARRSPPGTYSDFSGGFPEDSALGSLLLAIFRLGCSVTWPALIVGAHDCSLLVNLVPHSDFLPPTGYAA